MLKCFLYYLIYNKMLPPSIFKKNAFHYLCFPSVNAQILNLITKRRVLEDWWTMTLFRTLYYQASPPIVPQEHFCFGLQCCIYSPCPPCLWQNILLFLDFLLKYFPHQLKFCRFFIFLCFTSLPFLHFQSICIFPNFLIFILFDPSFIP